MLISRLSVTISYIPSRTMELTFVSEHVICEHMIANSR